MEKLKTTIRVPTKDDYAYIETQFEGTPMEIKEKYDELKKAMNDVGFPTENDFYAFIQIIIDSDLTKWGTSADYEVLSPRQKDVMQSLKRFAKRKVNQVT